MIILHGENNLLSRQRLFSEMENFKNKTQSEVLKFDGQSVKLMDLRQALEPSSLLGGSSLIVIENLFSGRLSKEKQKIIDYLKKALPQNLIVWEGKKVDGRMLSFLKTGVLKFDLTPLIFHFLDSFFPGNTKNSLTLLHQCLEQEPPEIVFFMLARQIKQLILAADLGQKGLKQMDNWRAEKLIRQAQKFTLIKLMKIYRQLLKMEVLQKTGRIPFSLSYQLDLLVASL